LELGSAAAAAVIKTATTVRCGLRRLLQPQAGSAFAASRSPSSSPPLVATTIAVAPAEHAHQVRAERDLGQLDAGAPHVEHDLDQVGGRLARSASRGDLHNAGPLGGPVMLVDHGRTSARLATAVLVVREFAAGRVAGGAAVLVMHELRRRARSLALPRAVLVVRELGVAAIGGDVVQTAEVAEVRAELEVRGPRRDRHQRGGRTRPGARRRGRPRPVAAIAGVTARLPPRCSCSFTTKPAERSVVARSKAIRAARDHLRVRMRQGRYRARWVGGSRRARRRLQRPYDVGHADSFIRARRSRAPARSSSRAARPGRDYAASSNSNSTRCFVNLHIGGIVSIVFAYPGFARDVHVWFSYKIVEPPPAQVAFSRFATSAGVAT